MQKTPHILWFLLLIETASWICEYISCNRLLLEPSVQDFWCSTRFTFFTMKCFLPHHSEICDEQWRPSGWASSVDSLYSQPGVMSVPRALKLTLIAALKIITKQQESVLGQCTAVKDTLMFSEIYSGGRTPDRSENKGLMLPSKLDFIPQCLNFNIWCVHPFAAVTAAHLSGAVSD